MKKPETMKSERDKGQAKKNFKELWENKATRWVIVVFAIVVVVTITEYVILAVK